MALQMTPRDLNNQFANDTQKAMFNGFNIMLATGLAFAILSLLAIARGLLEGDNRVDYLLRFPYWGVSVLAICMVNLKVHTYGRFITHRMTIWDQIIPFTKALVAAVLFAVLGFESRRIWSLWPLVFGFFAGVSYLKIRYYMNRFDETGVPPETAKLIRMIKENTKKNDLRFTLFFCIFFLAVWVLLNFVPPLPFMAHLSTNWQTLLAIPAGFGMIMAILADRKIRAEIDRLAEAQIDDKPKKPDMPKAA